MPISHFIITSDRGTTKAFEVTEPPNRRPMPRLVVEKEFKEAHQRYRDKVTDKAGGFPVRGYAGQGNAIAERQGIDLEEDAKLFRAIGHEIEKILRQHQPSTWAFAAPEEINHLILDHVSPDLRRRLRKDVKRDLTRVPAESLLQHFE